MRATQYHTRRHTQALQQHALSKTGDLPQFTCVSVSTYTDVWGCYNDNDDIDVRIAAISKYDLNPHYPHLSALYNLYPVDCFVLNVNAPRAVWKVLPMKHTYFWILQSLRVQTRPGPVVACSVTWVLCVGGCQEVVMWGYVVLGGVWIEVRIYLCIPALLLWVRACVEEVDSIGCLRLNTMSVNLQCSIVYQRHTFQIKLSPTFYSWPLEMVIITQYRRVSVWDTRDFDAIIYRFLSISIYRYNYLYSIITSQSAILIL